MLLPMVRKNPQHPLLYLRAFIWGMRVAEERENVCMCVCARYGFLTFTNWIRDGMMGLGTCYGRSFYPD